MKTIAMGSLSSIWYNDKRLWTAGGYIILSGIETQLLDTHEVFLF